MPHLCFLNSYMLLITSFLRLPLLVDDNYKPFMLLLIRKFNNSLHQYKYLFKKKNRKNNYNAYSIKIIVINYKYVYLHLLKK